MNHAAYSSVAFTCHANHLTPSLSSPLTLTAVASPGNDGPARASGTDGTGEPAWGTALGKRIVAYPKVHVIDSGLAGWLLGLSAAEISSRDPAVLTEFGHLVETFAVGEILKQVSWSEAAWIGPVHAEREQPSVRQ